MPPMARRYEGSPKDLREDRKGAKTTGKSLRDYEKTARDKREDKAGQKAMAAGRFGRK
jgi:hypothetical protein